MNTADGYTYRSGVLHCGGVAVPDIASAVGTPFYLYNLTAVRERYLRFVAAFDGIPHELCYAMKANSAHALLAMLAGLGSGFDVNSRGELFRALHAGAAPSKISMTGVGKSEQDIVDGLAADIATFNVESVEECRRINMLAARSGVKARIILRLNPDVNAFTHPHIATGEAHHKFGLPKEDILTLLASFSELAHLHLLGFAVHLGSQILDTVPFSDGLRRLFELAAEARERLGSAPEILDIGGGMGVPYHEDEDEFAPEQLAQLVRGFAEEFDLKETRIVSEPGRYLVANTGILVCGVEYLKRSGGHTFAILDGGMNDLLRPALYSADHAIIPVIQREGAKDVPMSIVGPVCESSDTFAEEQLRPELREHDLLAILSCGAYASSMASNYNSRTLAAEVACLDGVWQVIRPRQTVEQLVEHERPFSPPAP